MEREIESFIDEEMPIMSLVRASRVKSSWVKKNVDLSLFSDQIEIFLRSKGLKTRRNVLEEGYALLGTMSLPDRYGSVIVRILGNANDFEVEFILNKPARSPTKWGHLITLFGGGSILLRNMKSREAIEKLEREFWILVSEAVTKLSGSAKPAV